MTFKERELNKLFLIIFYSNKLHNTSDRSYTQHETHNCAFYLHKKNILMNCFIKSIYEYFNSTKHSSSFYLNEKKTHAGTQKRTNIRFHFVHFKRTESTAIIILTHRYTHTHR